MPKVLPFMTRMRGSVRTVVPSRRAISRGFVPYTLYDTALNYSAYGRPAQMGDFFGDVMSAVVGKSNWDARPEWMKKIAVKPDPARLLSTAAKVVPPRLVGRVVGQANQAGFDMYYNTPAGSIPINQETAEGLYSNYPAFARTRDVFSSVPWWVYALGVGGIAVAFMMRK